MCFSSGLRYYTIIISHQVTTVRLIYDFFIKIFILFSFICLFSKHLPFTAAVTVKSYSINNNSNMKSKEIL